MPFQSFFAFEKLGTIDAGNFLWLWFSFLGLNLKNIDLHRMQGTIRHLFVTYLSVRIRASSISIIKGFLGHIFTVIISKRNVWIKCLSIRLNLPDYLHQGVDRFQVKSFAVLGEQKNSQQCWYVITSIKQRGIMFNFYEVLPSRTRKWPLDLMPVALNRLSVDISILWVDELFWVIHHLKKGLIDI